MWCPQVGVADAWHRAWWGRGLLPPPRSSRAPGTPVPLAGPGCACLGAAFEAGPGWVSPGTPHGAWGTHSLRGRQGVASGFPVSWARGRWEPQAQPCLLGVRPGGVRREGQLDPRMAEGSQTARGGPTLLTGGNPTREPCAGLSQAEWGRNERATSRCLGGPAQLSACGGVTPDGD